VVAVTAMAPFMGMLDATIVNIAFPDGGPPRPAYLAWLIAF
jgi:hypothetical protein